MILKKHVVFQSHCLAIFVQINVQTIPVNMEGLATILFRRIIVSALQGTWELTAD